MRPPIRLHHWLEACPYPLNGLLTIIYDGEDSVNDPATLALQALGWVLSDQSRAQRLLDLTGLSPDALRTGLDEPSTHRAIFDFLFAHEPDLVGAAAALGIAPEALAAAGRNLRA